MKKVFIALVVIAFAAGTIVYILRRPPKPTGRPAVPPKYAAKGYDKPVHNPALTPAMVADRILIEKSARRLTLFRGNEPIRQYRVALGREPEGKKTTEGDCRTPEGCYVIDYRNANSEYHRALHISYPNENDRLQAAERGVSPGCDIMIHGLKNGMGWVGRGHLMTDWTLGCIAVTDREIDEIWRLAPIGTKVEIVP